MKFFKRRLYLMVLSIIFFSLPLAGFAADLCSSVFLPVDVAYIPLKSVARDLAFSIEKIYGEYPSMSDLQKKSAIEFIVDVFKNDSALSGLLTLTVEKMDPCDFKDLAQDILIEGTTFCFGFGNSIVCDRQSKPTVS